MKMQLAVILALLSLATDRLFADTRFTILQTSDIHSHFTNRESPDGLGGVARLQHKVNEIRGSIKNTLFLDAGDWSEGSIFFTLNAGEASQRVMETLGYDAIVLGNHDWLIGPKELYKTFQDAQMKIPVLSANLNMSHLDPSIHLRDYIKPYIVKEIEGVKIGIVGLSTFEMIYDGYFKPVKLMDPVRTTRKAVEQLRKKEGCSVVIILSHLGITVDKMMAKVPGVDYIVGGHTHILLKKPIKVGNTLISHVGKHAEYLGQIDLVLRNGKLELEDYKIHPMNEAVPEDPYMSALVNGYIRQLEQKFGNIFNDNIVRTEIDMPLQSKGESAFYNMTVDGMREVAGADVAFDNPMFSSRDFYRGWLSSVDFFNALSHIYNRNTDKAWTVNKFQIKGVHLRGLVSGFVRFNYGNAMSNAKIVVDKDRKLDQVVSFKIDGQEVNLLRNYEVAGTQGVLEAIDFLKSHGINLSNGPVKDTGIEAWRVAASKAQSLSPITREKLPWEGRLRSIQGDLFTREEDILVHYLGGSQIDLEFVIRNNGFKPSSPASIKVTFDPTPHDTLDDAEAPVEAGAEAKPIPPLDGGQPATYLFHWNTAGLKPGRYKVTAEITGEDAKFSKNNIIETYVDVP